MTNSAIKNFQIPVLDFDRALSFYSQVMGYELEQMHFGNTQLGIFRFNGENGGVGGTIIKDEKLKSSGEGTMVYLDAGNDLQPNLDRVENAGGSVEIGKTSLGPDMGFFAIFFDSEGNKVGLYSKE